MAPDSFSESATKSTTMRMSSTPDPQPIKALQGFFSKLCPRSGVSSEDSVEEPLDKGSEKVVQLDGETSQVTDNQQQSSPDNLHLKLDCHEEVTPEALALNTMEQQKTEGTPSNGKGPQTSPHLTCFWGCATKFRSRKQSGQNKTRGTGSKNKCLYHSQEEHFVIHHVWLHLNRLRAWEGGEDTKQDKKNFVLITVGKKDPQKTTPTSADPPQMTETCPTTAAVKDKGSNSEAELSKPQALKSGTDRAQVRRCASKEAVQKKTSPAYTNTRSI